MLRNRSRAVTSKQALMADHFLSSPSKNPSSPISSFLNSPRFFNGFLSKNLFSEAETPTSILDTKHSSSFVNPFGYDPTSVLKSSNTDITDMKFHKLEPQAIGLALIDSINDEPRNDGIIDFSKPVNRMVLLGSKLKVQIPPFNPPTHIPGSISPVESHSPKSPADFGIKTRGSQLLSPFVGNTEKMFTRQLSLKEMELSEDYTCVITHGPNPKTTHIFGNCIVKSCSADESEFLDFKKMDCDFEPEVPIAESVNFMSFCHTCKDNLEQGKDIYIYRGEKAFCSQECRDHEILFEAKNPDMDDGF